MRIRSGNGTPDQAMNFTDSGLYCEKVLQEVVDLAMRSNEERLRLMYERAAGLREEKEKAFLLVSGNISALLFTVLLNLTVYCQGKNSGCPENHFAASSLL